MIYFDYFYTKAINVSYNYNMTDSRNIFIMTFIFGYHISYKYIHKLLIIYICSSVTTLFK